MTESAVSSATLSSHALAPDCPLACSSAASPLPSVLVIPTSVSFQERSHTFLLLLLIPGILFPVIIAWSDSYSSFKACLLQEAFFDFPGWPGSACTHSHGRLGSSPHKRHLVELQLSVGTSALSTRFGLCMSVSSARIEDMYLWSACEMSALFEALGNSREQNKVQMEMEPQ